MQLARGKKNCEKVFEHAIAKYQIPLRTKEEEAVVEGTKYTLFYYTRVLLLVMLAVA